MNKQVEIVKPIFLYTLFSSLGDFLIIGDLINKVEKLIPESRCYVAHRNNPHVPSWRHGLPKEYFFNIYHPSELFQLVLTLREKRKEGMVFGLQQAPGSMQGFLFLNCFKKFKAVDYIVDFNLYNADIITPPKGQYILELHLNQIRDLLKIEIPQDYYHLDLPISAGFKKDLKSEPKTKIRIGIHPWSRRGNLKSFIWPFKNWLEIIRYLLNQKDLEIVIFGRDQQFEAFKKYLRENLEGQYGFIKFSPSESVSHLIETINSFDILLSVNTSVVHIGCALKKTMIILCGPTLDTWIPKGPGIKILKDEIASFPGSDKYIPGEYFPSISRIDVNKVLEAIREILKK